MRTARPWGCLEVRREKKGSDKDSKGRETREAIWKKKETRQRSSGHCYAIVFDFSRFGSSLSYSQLTRAFLFLYLCPHSSAFSSLTTTTNGSENGFWRGRKRWKIHHLNLRVRNTLGDTSTGFKADRWQKKEGRSVLMLSGRVRSSRYCPAAGAVLLIASLITLVIFNLPLPPWAYLKQEPPCARPGLD